MIKTTTQNDLVRYVYNETQLLDSDRIQRAIDGDPILGNEFQEIVMLTQMMDSVRPEPSEKVIQKILSLA